MATTAIHRMVQRCRDGEYAPMVARLATGWVVMGERQPFAGYCLLLPDPVVDHLNVLDADRCAQFLADMALTGRAVLECTAATRINYAMFGNVEPALHAHVFPRHGNEPVATRTAHPWAVDWSLAPEYSDAPHGDLKRRIAARLKELTARA
jgi:diadenosine tetraphosphate (Ap4A) HIT family hydrolase